jgi:predicted ATPase
LKEAPEIAKGIAPILEKTIGGSVEVKEDGSFWIKKEDGKQIPFSMEADGLKRFGLVWQLLMNESITRNSVVLWDEPESSINPKNIPVLVDAMLEMQRNGVQIVAATHSYSFARYFDVLRKKDDKVQFVNLVKKNGSIAYTSGLKFTDIRRDNSIDDAGEKLYEDIINKSLGDMQYEQHI